VAIARAGGDIQFYGTIGRDGDWIQKKMHEYQVDTRGLLVTDVSPSYGIYDITIRPILVCCRNNQRGVQLSRWIGTARTA
jgi:sugar/nucleoside kinase (ribokinase family)